jgi:hypothetical protein
VAVGSKKAKRKKPNPKSDKAQSSRFLEAAKKLEADESGESFAKAIDVLVPKRQGEKG